MSVAQSGAKYYNGVPGTPVPRSLGAARHPASVNSLGGPNELPLRDTVPPTVHHARELLSLNVGGKVYVTLYETLARSHSSYFERLVTFHQESGKVYRHVGNIIDDGSGGIFINRDGDLFAYVLQFLRDGRNIVLPDNVGLLKQIRREAEYFGLFGLRDAINAQLADTEDKKAELNEVLQAIRSTTNQISQSLYVTNFSRKINY